MHVRFQQMFKNGDDEVCIDCLASNMMLPNCLECEHYKEVKNNE